MRKTIKVSKKNQEEMGTCCYEIDVSKIAFREASRQLAQAEMDFKKTITRLYPQSAGGTDASYFPAEKVLRYTPKGQEGEE